MVDSMLTNTLSLPNLPPKTIKQSTMSVISQFSCKPLITLSFSSQNPQLNPKSSLLLASNSHKPTSSLKLGWMPSKPIALSLSTRAKREIQVRAAEDDAERSPEAARGDSGAVAVVVAEAPAGEEDAVATTKIEDLKKKLVDAFSGTERGLRASSETRSEIMELINQLEALNPTPAPTQALSLLHGKWILVYTSFSGLYPLLSSSTLPLVKVEEISQTIDSENLTVQNSVKFAGPLATTSLSTNAKFEVCSPKRVQIKFVEGIIGTPQITDSIVLPENVEFLGQKIDLTPFKGLLNSVQDTASSVARTISNRPPFKFNLSQNAESWLLTTYLDEELRISRGDAGSVFVFIKEGSPLLGESAT